MLHRLPSDQVRSQFQEYSSAAAEELPALRDLGLSELPQAIVSEILSDFIQGFNQTAKEIRLALLEQFISVEAISDEQLVAVTSDLDFSERKALGEFLGLCISPGSYVHTFHDCFEALDHRSRSQLIERFMLEDPQHAIMVAPFVNFDYYYVQKRGREVSVVKSEKPRSWGVHYGPHGTANQCSFLTYYFDNAELAGQLMDSGLRLKAWSSASSVIDYLGTREPCFLVPYLPELCSRDLVSPEQIQHYFVGIDKQARPILTMRSFYEASAKTELRTHCQQQLAKLHQENLRDYDWINPSSYDSPRALIDEYVALENENDKNLLEHLSGNFLEAKACLGKNVEGWMLQTLLGSGYPVFSYLDSFGLSKSDLKTLFGYVEYQSFFPCFAYDLDDFVKLVEAGVESRVVRSLIETIRSNEGKGILRQLLWHADTVFPVLSEHSQRKICNCITQNMPSLWRYNISFALKNTDLSITELATHAFQDLYSLEECYRAFRKYLQQDQESQFGVAELNQLARDNLSVSCEALLEFSAAEVLFTPEELSELLRKGLRQGDPDFLLYGLIDPEPWTQKGVSRDEIIAVLREYPTTWLIEYSPEVFWGPITRVFSLKERLDFIVDVLVHHKVGELVDDRNIVGDLVYSRPHAERLISDLSERAYFTELAELGAELKKMTHTDTELEADESDVDRLFSEYGIEVVEQPTHCESVFIDRTDPEALSATAAKAHAIELFKRICGLLDSERQENFSLLFNRDVRFCLGSNAQELLLAGVDQYFTEFPQQILLQRSVLNSTDLTRVMDAQLAYIAYKVDDPIYLSRVIPNNLRTKILRICPLARVYQQKTLDQDFYLHVIDEIAELPVFELFEPRLRAIARREIKNYGTRCFVEGFNYDSEFIEIVQLLTAISNSPNIQKCLPAIASFDVSTQKELIGLIGVAVEFGEVFLSLMKIDSGDQEYAVSKLRNLIWEKFAKDFEVDSYDLTEARAIDAELFKALFVYGGAVCKADAVARQRFTGLAPYLVHKHFNNWRSWGVCKDSLSADEMRLAFKEFQHQQLLPQKMSFEAYQLWQTDIALSLEEVLEFDIEDLRDGIVKILDQAVSDGHLPEYNPSVEQPVARSYLQALKTIEVDDLRKGTIAVSNKELSFSDVWKNLTQVYQASSPLFLSDIKTLQKMLDDARSSLSAGTNTGSMSFNITDVVDFKTYFFIGKYPVQSCQSCEVTHLGSEYYLGLLAYVVDPQVKIVQIYNKDQRLVARAVLRLMETVDEEPQVFLERIYTVNNHPKVRDAILKFAINKAHSIGANLYVHSDDGFDFVTEQQASVTLYAYGSRWSHTYTDAGGGLKRNGRFVIRGARLVGG